MSGQAWVFVIVVAAIAAAVGFLVGRSGGKDTKKKLCDAEAEITRKNDELATYKRQVDEHFDRTATLFVSMAGSYKSLFEHLSTGYEQLSDGRSSRDLFRERVATLLLDGPQQDEAVTESAAAAAAPAVAVPVVDTSAENVEAAEQAVAREEAALQEQAVPVEPETETSGFTTPQRLEPVIGEELKAEIAVPAATTTEPLVETPAPVVEPIPDVPPVDTPPVDAPATDRKP